MTIVAHNHKVTAIQKLQSCSRQKKLLRKHCIFDDCDFNSHWLVYVENARTILKMHLAIFKLSVGLPSYILIVSIR